jgi:hypothetical protein
VGGGHEHTASAEVLGLDDENASSLENADTRAMVA